MKLRDRVHRIIKDHPNGILSSEIRQRLDQNNPHDRCMVAHVLTQLFRAKLVSREPAVSNSAKTFIYKDAMNTKQFLIETIGANPGISSTELRRIFKTKSTKKVENVSATLTEMSNRKLVKRELKLIGEQKTYCYWMTDGEGRVAAPDGLNGKADAARLIDDSPAPTPTAEARKHIEGIKALLKPVQAADAWKLSTLPLAPGLRAAALACDLQAEIGYTDEAYRAACADCARRIRELLAI